MSRALIVSLQNGMAGVVVAMALVGTTSAQTVWSGFSVEFSKAAFADPTLAENQDRITENVWLTRSVQEGLFNARSETGYLDGLSPGDTEWATELIPANAGKSIAAANWANLIFDDWIGAYGGRGTQGLPTRLTSYNAVVHLITDNIYLDLQFTSWSISGGGSFSYQRATGTLPPPTPTGDYNGNGTVDAADYVVWRDTYGQAAVPSGSGADGDLSGMIDDPDYDFWRARFGNVIPAVATGNSSFAVPEPVTDTVLLFWMFVLNGISRRRR